MRLITEQKKSNLVSQNGTSHGAVETEVGKLICVCGCDEFTTYGNHIFGITVVTCRVCDRKTSLNIVSKYYPMEKLLSAYGEDYCNIIGTMHRNKPVVTELWYPLFGTKRKIKIRKFRRF